MLCHGIFLHRLYDYIWLYVPNGRCTSRIWIWGGYMGIGCVPIIPLGFSTHEPFNASATFSYMYYYRWNSLCHGDFSSLMWLSTPWCDFSVSPLYAAVPWGWCDFSRLMWLKYGACSMRICVRSSLGPKGFHHPWSVLPMILTTAKRLTSRTW